MSENIWSEIFRNITGKPTGKELKIYQDYYGNAKKKGDLFCDAISYDKGKLDEYACNFLYYLNQFKLNVPRRIRKKKFENFKLMEDMAKDILRNSLSKLEKGAV